VLFIDKAIRNRIETLASYLTRATPIEMSDQADFESSGLQEVANAVRDNPGESNSQKRKREAADLGSGDTSSRRTNFKRATALLKKHNEMNAESGNAFDHQQENDAAVESLQDYSTENQNGTADHANASSTAAAALGIYPTMTIPQPTSTSFTSPPEGDRHQDSSFNMGDDSQQNDSFSMTPSGNTTGGRSSKPAVGSEEWHKVRKDNHKEVERRRRETINEGITELAKIVPGCEKNKGSILQRAVSFIQQLKENEANNIEKWTLEKLLTEQAIAELSASNDKLKAECERAWREVETWKKTCQSAGLTPKKEEGASVEDES